MVLGERLFGAGAGRHRFERYTLPLNSKCSKQFDVQETLDFRVPKAQVGL